MSTIAALNAIHAMTVLPEPDGAESNLYIRCFCTWESGSYYNRESADRALLDGCPVEAEIKAGKARAGRRAVERFVAGCGDARQPRATEMGSGER